MTDRPFTRAQLARLLREHAAANLFDESVDSADGTAIYTLSDPREIRRVRYVGQTNAPRRRLLQHLNTARLWMPEERPWWVKSPKLRPLYDWIRELYAEERRLPVMVITVWVTTAREARAAERAQIHECLRQQLPLLNFERELLGPQIPLV